MLLVHIALSRVACWDGLAGEAQLNRLLLGLSIVFNRIATL